jgi:transposase
MLKNVTQVGIDSHKNFGSMCMRDAHGQKVGRMRLEYRDRPKLARQLGLLPAGTPVIVEGSFGWSWLCDEVERRKLMPHLASALKVSMFRAAKHKAKSNRIDADALSELPLNDRWWEVWLPPQQVRDRREILRFRMGLVREQTRVKNRILHDFSDLFGARGRRFLADLAREPKKEEPKKSEKTVMDPLLREAGRAVLRGHLNQLAHLRSQIAEATRMFRRQMVRDPAARILRTIPGLGIVLAYTVLAEVGDFRRFPNGHHLASYACLVPVANDSGDDDESAPQGRHIGRMGRRTLQWAFIEAAHGAVKRDAWLRDIFDRRTDNGTRDKNRGYIAVARQLCRMTHACVKENRAYYPAPAPAGGGVSPAGKKKENKPSAPGRRGKI